MITTTIMINILILIAVLIILVGISITDIFTFTIPYELNGGLFLLSIGYLINNFNSQNLKESLIIFGIMIVTNVLIQVYGKFVKKNDGFGLGDSTMLVSLGLFLNFGNLTLFLMSFSVICFICVFYMIIFKKKYLPMGNFISISLMSAIILSVSENMTLAILSIPVSVVFVILLYYSFKNTMKEVEEQKGEIYVYEKKEK